MLPEIFVSFLVYSCKKYYCIYNCICEQFCEFFMHAGINSSLCIINKGGSERNVCINSSLCIINKGGSERNACSC